MIAERGLEYTTVTKQVDAGEGKTARVTVAPARWIDMRRRGWWSADFHVHRPIEDTLVLAVVEGVNLAVIFTMWNGKNLWEGRELPASSVLRADSSHLVSVMNAEDERGGGAWMLHNLRRPLDLTRASRWFPPGKFFVERVREQRAWFDVEKGIWWEVPVMLALAPPDSWGLVNNHLNQYGVYAQEAWGRPRDRKQYPGAEGFVAYSLELYYRYLNLGFRLPVSAGSASGVVPNPVGQNRMYAYLGDDSLDVARYYAAVRAGRTFATNGPMLFFKVNGHLPGATVDSSGRENLALQIEVLSRDVLDRVEIVANGEVIDRIPAGPGQMHMSLTRAWEPANHTWLAARCFAKTSEGVRLAHTSPVYLGGPRALWDARADASYFVTWIDELISLNGEPGRFRNIEERDTVASLYRQAREFYAERAR